MILCMERITNYNLEYENRAVLFWVQPAVFLIASPHEDFIFAGTPLSINSCPTAQKSPTP